MGLPERINRFDKFCANFSCSRPSPLIAVHKIDQGAYDKLERALIAYVSRCVWACSNPPLDEPSLMKELGLKREQIENCTPNGILKPYRHLNPEFNTLYKAYADIIRSLNIKDHIGAFFGLLDVRYKEGTVYSKNIGRDYSTEEIHSDAWSFGISDCIRVLIPMLGDADGNKVEFYAPPENFDESWLDPLASYENGAEIARRYSKVDISVPKGSMCFFDFAVLHQTVRSQGAGGRVSLGHTIYARIPKNEKNDPVYPYLTFNDLMGIGKNKFLDFSSFDEGQSASPKPKHWELTSIP